MDVLSQACHDDMTGDEGGLSDLAHAVKQLREERGWSQKELDARTGMKSTGMIESGRRTRPRYSTMLRLARAFDITVEALAKLAGDESLAQEDGPPQPDGPLQEFLDTKAPRDIKQEEIQLLRGVHAAGRKPTIDTYSLALLMFRSMKLDDEP